MKYARHRSNFSSRRTLRQRRGRLWMWGVVGILGFFLIAALIHKQTDASPETAALVDVMEEIVEEKVALVDDTKKDNVQQITLDYVADEGLGGGIARRGTSAGVFTHVVVADLPAIDSSQELYEGWLVKPGVTQFFSTGTMFARADGKWGLVWEEDESETVSDLDDYTKVVITRERRDGDPAPSPVHMLEGAF